MEGVDWSIYGFSKGSTKNGATAVCLGLTFVFSAFRFKA